MMHSNNLALPQQQQGVALAISLVLLVVMTIVGITTLSGTRLTEKIASNAQQKAIAFEAAESAINSVWSTDQLMISIQAFSKGPHNDPPPFEPEGVEELLSKELDQKRPDPDRTTVDLDAKVTVQFCGESSLPRGASLSADESEVQMAGLLFDFNGESKIPNSNTRADHVQRGELVRYRTGRTGDCEVPGVL